MTKTPNPSKGKCIRTGDKHEWGGSPIHCFRCGIDKPTKDESSWEDIDKIIIKRATENEFGDMFIWEDDFDELIKDIKKFALTEYNRGYKAGCDFASKEIRKFRNEIIDLKPIKAKENERTSK